MEQTSNYIVLGASGDIGAEVVRNLLSLGNRVLLASRASDRLENLVRETDCLKFELDARNSEEVAGCFNFAKEQFGPIDGVVNSIGSVLLKPAHMTRDAEWQDVINTNLTTAFNVVRASAKTMVEQGGSVVLISSAAARIGLSNHEAIAAAKAGIEGLTRSAAATYAGNNLRFNAVAPGLVKTQLTEKIWKSERAAKGSTSMHALGRLGEPSDIASMVCWLLDPKNTWVSGEVFSVDGGLGNLHLMQKA